MKKLDKIKLWVFNIERFAIHDGPGIRTTVFLQGCPLRCRWCANPESWECGIQIMHLDKKCTGCGRCVSACPKEAIYLDGSKAVIRREKCVKCGKCVNVCLNGVNQTSGKEMSLDEIMKIIIRDEDYYTVSDGGVTFSGGEALLYIERMRPLLEEIKALGISIAFETCGNVSEEKIATANKYADLFLYDIKSLDADALREYTKGNLDLILGNLLGLAAKNPEKIVLRVPVIPGFNDAKGQMEKLVELAVSKKICRVDILPYHTLGITKYRQLGIEYPLKELESMQPERLAPFAELGRKKGLNVRIER